MGYQAHVQRVQFAHLGVEVEFRARLIDALYSAIFQPGLSHLCGSCLPGGFERLKDSLKLAEPDRADAGYQAEAEPVFKVALVHRVEYSNTG